jgi:hypothetical protein
MRRPTQNGSGPVPGACVTSSSFRRSASGQHLDLLDKKTQD